MTDFPFASGHHIAWYTTLLLILSLFKMLMFYSLWIVGHPFLFLEISYWASLAAQWWRVYLPMQGTQVQPLLGEYPTGQVATEPMQWRPRAYSLSSPAREASAVRSLHTTTRAQLLLTTTKVHMQQQIPSAAKDQ